MLPTKVVDADGLERGRKDSAFVPTNLLHERPANIAKLRSEIGSICCLLFPDCL